ALYITCSDGVFSFHPLISIPITPTSPTSSLFPYTTLFRSEYVLPGEGTQVSDGGRLALLQIRFDNRFSMPQLLMITILALLCRRSEEHTSELQSRFDLVCRLLLEKNKSKKY